VRKRKTVICISLVLLFLLFVLGLALGSAEFSFVDSILALFGIERADNAVLIVRSLRLPRVLGGIFAGAALAVSGLLLQCATGNDLAAPNIIGVNSGAGLFVMLVLCLLPSLSAFIPIAAFIGASLSALLVLGLSHRSRSPMSKTTVVLSGVATGALMSAGISFLSLLYPDALASYTSFSVGGLSGVFFEDITVPVLIISVFLVFGLFLTPHLNLLALGDDMAASMGVKVVAVRTAAVLTAAILASSAVSYVGLVGFVGLIVPHISRRLLGSDNRYILPLSAVLGASLMTLSDILSRVMFAPSELPCGILISAVGAPFFLVLLCGGRRGSDAGM